MKMYIFPFNQVDKGEKIILWGMGVVGKQYVNEILATNYCHIEFAIDDAAKNRTYMGIDIYRPEEILHRIDTSYLYVISVFRPDIAEDIKKQMLQVGVMESRIIYNPHIYDFTEYMENIVENYEPWNEKIDLIQRPLIKKGYYISGMPFWIKNTGREKEYFQIEQEFCETNSIINCLDQTRVYFLWQNVENILSETKGDVAEIGVYQGATARILKKICQKYCRRLYLFDTFEGFNISDITGIDNGKGIEGFKDTSLEFVERVLGKDENICIRKGYFPETINEEVSLASYAFVHIDCDLYKPLEESLNFFWPRLENGGMIAIHDYSSGFWEGATKAVDEFCKNNKVVKVLIPDWSGTVALIKGFDD